MFKYNKAINLFGDKILEFVIIYNCFESFIYGFGKHKNGRFEEISSN